MRTDSAKPLPVAVVVITLLAACESGRQGSTVPDDPSATGALPSLVRYTESREPCADRRATRNAYFGDLHIHTAFSYDARPFGTETTPADAYRFAQGEPIPVPPYDDQGNPAAMQQLERPLDFAAVTDHSEFFGEMELCFDPASSVYDISTCRLIREGAPRALFRLVAIARMTDPKRLAEICGEGGDSCAEAAASVWDQTQAMAEAAYDRSSACTFTTFVGYEYTGTPDGNNIHRNVIFRNDRVPEQAISYVETPTDRGLWDQLKEQCLEGMEGCDVLAIPHNSNLSAGAMFPSYIGRFESVESAQAAAELRNAMEPVMEIFQHKGNSECFNGLPDILGAPDELCEMEQVLEVDKEYDIFGRSGVVKFCDEGEVGTAGFNITGCISKNDFYRSVLLTGLQDRAVIGINSYKMGAIASTDTHLSLSGETDEAHWEGHLPREIDLSVRLTDPQGYVSGLNSNPGGLAGVWAVENARDAVFEALRRREVFGTTGSRIKPRLFGGWDINADACGLDDTAAHGYDRAVPMGDDFSARPAGAVPRLLITAEADLASAPLQKLQVIKGWVDSDGRSRYEIFDVAGAENEAGAFDLTTGKWSGSGDDALCAVFEDTAFDPEEPAYYYLRVVEVPTLRWSSSTCLDLPAEARPDECNNDAPQTVQEMAWTSPIWYLPPSN